MWKDSLNLVEMIRGDLTGEAADRISSIVGESGEKTRAGISAAVPALLAGLDRSASTPDGVRRISSAVDDADGSMLDNPQEFFGTSSTGETGSGILHSILGANGLSELVNSIGRTSGLSRKTATAMLGLLTPVVFGVFKRVKRMIGSNQFDIADLLASQRGNIAAAMPRTMRQEIYGDSGIEPLEPVAESDAEARPAPSARRNYSWIVPLALLAGALGLLWYLRARPRDTAFVPPSTVHAGREETTTRARTMLSLDALITKYGSVIQEAQAQGVQISEMNEENGKLVIKGIAPSLEAANNVWNEIKRVNPSLDDIRANFAITDYRSSTEPSREKPTGPGNSSNAVPATSTGQTYTVQPGDTLRSISKHFYGNMGDYKRILNANRDKIENKDVIRVGQELSIP
jgi:LysM repeat protein